MQVVVLHAQDQLGCQRVLDADAGGPPRLAAARGGAEPGVPIVVADVDLGIGDAGFGIGEPAPVGVAEPSGEAEDIADLHGSKEEGDERRFSRGVEAERAEAYFHAGNELPPLLLPARVNATGYGRFRLLVVQGLVGQRGEIEQGVVTDIHGGLGAGVGKPEASADIEATPVVYEEAG